MSHVAHIELHVVDLQALKLACKSLGLEFLEGKQEYRWFGEWLNDYQAQEAAVSQGFDPEEFGKNAQHVLGIPGNEGAYQVGLVKRVDGKPGWSLLYDNWCGGKGLEAVIGKRAGKLKQAYAVQVAKKAALGKGYRVKESVGTDGVVKLVCMK